MKIFENYAIKHLAVLFSLYILVTSCTNGCNNYESESSEVDIPIVYVSMSNDTITLNYYDTLVKIIPCAVYMSDSLDIDSCIMITAKVIDSIIDGRKRLMFVQKTTSKIIYPPIDSIDKNDTVWDVQGMLTVDSKISVKPLIINYIIRGFLIQSDTNVLDCSKSIFYYQRAIEEIHRHLRLYNTHGPEYLNLTQARLLLHDAYYNIAYQYFSKWKIAKRKRDIEMASAYADSVLINCDSSIKYDNNSSLPFAYKAKIIYNENIDIDKLTELCKKKLKDAISDREEIELNEILNYIKLVNNYKTNAKNNSRYESNKYVIDLLGEIEYPYTLNNCIEQIGISMNN